MSMRVPNWTMIGRFDAWVRGHAGHGGKDARPIPDIMTGEVLTAYVRCKCGASFELEIFDFMHWGKNNGGWSQVQQDPDTGAYRAVLQAAESIEPEPERKSGRLITFE